MSQISPSLTPASSLVVPRFGVIEGARSLLAWWVVLAHLIDFSGFDAVDLPAILRPLRQGILPVYVFMMISGFVITHLLTTKDEPYFAYALRRFFRLMPLQLTVLIAVVIAATCGLAVTRVPEELLLKRFMIEATMLNGFMPKAWEAANWGSLNTPNWSISVEMQFYLVAPLILLPAIKGGWGRRVSVVLFFALLAASFLSYGRWLCYSPGVSCVQFPHPSFLPMVAIYFAVGAATYLLAFRREELRWGAGGCFLLILPIVLMEGALIPTLLWASIVALIISPENRASRLLSSRALVTLGTISYSTYLIHFPLVVYAAFLAKKLGLEPESLKMLAFMSGTVIPVVLVLSFVSYRYIERPGIKAGAQLVARLSRSRAV